VVSKRYIPLKHDELIQKKVPRRYNEAHNTDGGRAISGVYRLDTNLTLIELLDYKVRVANTICFSLDGGTLYFCDSPTKRIMAYDNYNADSAEASLGPGMGPGVRPGLGAGRVFYEMPADAAGFPDGATVDSSGALWSAHFGGGCAVLK
jgi:L-arabinonolactonase